MELSEQEIQEIERYHAGQLTGEALQTFEKRLKTDVEFAQEVDTFRGLDLMFKAGRRDELRSQVKASSKRVKQQDGLQKRNLWMAVAAIVLVTIGVSWFFAGRTTTGPSLYQTHYSQYEIGGPDRTDGAPITDYSLAWDAYLKGDYPAALTFFENVPTTDTAYWQIQVYRGCCLYHQKQYAAGMKVFEDMRADKNNGYWDVATWYIALGALATEDPTLAIARLQELKASGAQYQSAAVDDILSEIE